jgi:nucleotide-binding universal stress UspA family protein
MISRILVGIDGSPFAEKALKYAVNLAKTYRASLLVLHAFLRRFYAVSPSEAGVLATTVYVKEVEAEGRAIMNKAESYVKEEGLECDCRLVQGVPADEIVKTAEAEKADLIVIGSRGLTEVRAFLLGSVSDKVTHHSKCPILIVK